MSERPSRHGLPWDVLESKKLSRALNAGGIPLAVKTFEGQRSRYAINTRASDIGFHSAYSPGPGGIALVGVEEVKLALGYRTATCGHNWIKAHPRAFRRGHKWLLPATELDAEVEARKGDLTRCPEGYLTTQQVSVRIGGQSGNVRSIAQSWGWDSVWFREVGRRRQRAFAVADVVRWEKQNKKRNSGRRVGMIAPTPWTPDEIKLAVDTHHAGGLKAAQEALPGRTTQAIRRKVWLTLRQAAETPQQAAA